jgi:hypothetical protein
VSQHESFTQMRPAEQSPSLLHVVQLVMKSLLAQTGTPAGDAAHEQDGPPQVPAAVRQKSSFAEQALAISVGVAVAVAVAVSVGVAVGVAVAVSVGVAVGVAVGVLVGVSVGVAVGVAVAVLVGGFVGVAVAVVVGVFVGVLVAVLVGVGVAVGVAQTPLLTQTSLSVQQAVPHGFPQQ